MNEDFDLVKSLLERTGSYVSSLELDRFDVLTNERRPTRLFSGSATIYLRIAGSSIQQIRYETAEKEEIEYFKSKLR